jgi:hypothetical protein
VLLTDRLSRTMLLNIPRSIEARSCLPQIVVVSSPSFRYRGFSQALPHSYPHFRLRVKTMLFKDHIDSKEER